MPKLLFTSPKRAGSDSIKWSLYPEDVLPLWVADMDFTSPPKVIEALQRRVQHGVFGYANESHKLAELIVERMERLYEWKITPEAVLIVPGVIAGFNLTAQAILQKGESIVIQPPIYPPFFGVAANAGATEIQCALENDGTGKYDINFNKLEKALSGASRMLLFCNPHNPIGKVYTREELEKVAKLCAQNNVYICSDEIHSDIVFAGNSHVPIASIDRETRQRTVTLIAPSKTYNIAGLDCSVLICENAELMKKIKQTRRGIMGGVNLLGTTAAIAAYQHGQKWLEEIMKTLQGNRDFLCEFVKEKLPKVRMQSPQATYLAWLDCRELALGVEPFDFFLQNAKVALNRGSEFGGDGRSFVRLNFGCDRRLLEKALERMVRALK